MTWANKTLSYVKPPCKIFFECYNKANYSGGICTVTDEVGGMSVDPTFVSRK